jgi:general stress protein YciG
MTGTRVGGQKAAAKNVAKDPNFYATIGKRGGLNGRTGGFASQVVGDDGLTGIERARIAGARGGRISRRKKAVVATATQDDFSLAA